MSTSYGSSPLLGQASSGWTESSSALRILNVGIRNTLGVAHESAFTQTNPPAVSGVNRTTSRLGPVPKIGVLSGSVAFTRGSGQVGGPGELYDPDPNNSGSKATDPESGAQVVVLGVFINSALGSNPYENIPAAASGRLPYVSGFGSYANGLYETYKLTGVANVKVTYASGVKLYASKNGYLTAESEDLALVEGAEKTLVGVCLIAPDSAHDELVYDQRV
jgi:hypothetical protein